MYSQIPASVKIEQPEVFIDDPDEDMRSMESHSLLPSDNIKLEPACEAGNVQSAAREIISEVQVFDEMDSEIPASVKIEPPEVYLDYPGDYQKIHPCSQSCSFPQEQLERDSKMVIGNIDWKLVKQELPGIKCEEKSHKFSKMMDMASCCSTHGVASHNNTELRILEDRTTLIPRQEVPLIGTEDGYTASQQHKHFSHMSESVSSKTEINTEIYVTNKNCELHTVKTPVRQTQISGKYLDNTFGYNSCSPQRIQEGATPHMFLCVSDVNISVYTFLNRQNATGTDEKPYKCGICDASFITAGSLNYHMRTHAGKKPYKCAFCGLCFTTASNRKCHEKTHTGERPYKCDVCGASFTITGNLKCHMKTHTREKPYKCDVCGASFTVACNLKCHMRTHSEEKPYKCDICSASFTQTGHLKCHMKTHTGERPYKCDVCGASYARNDHLKCHMRTHTGEKPYKCNVCGASYARNDSMKFHLRTHMKETPYKCDICAACFTVASQLKRHMRNHTGE